MPVSTDNGFFVSTEHLIMSQANHVMFLFTLCIGLVMVIGKIVGRPKYRGRYTRQINNYDLILPRKVNEDGSHLSYEVPHYYNLTNRNRRSTDDKPTIRFALNFKGVDYVVKLWPSYNLISPEAVVERRKRDIFLSDISYLGKEQCHYRGYVSESPGQSSVALSACKDGLVGAVHVKDNYFFVEPAANELPDTDGRHLHLTYKMGNYKRTKRSQKRKYAHVENSNNNIVQLIKQRMKIRIPEQLKRQDREVFKKKPFQDGQLTSKEKAKNENFNSTKTNTGTHWVATTIVGDKSFLNFHENRNKDSYITTLFNTASNIWHDASIGQVMNLVLVRIMYLENPEDQTQLNISSDAEGSLRRFNRWARAINPPPDHPNHHDVAVLLTKYALCPSEEPCDALGITSIGQACGADSGGILEDVGLATGTSLAHHMGHLLGLQDDSSGPFNDTIEAEGEAPSGCRGVVNSSVTVMSPDAVWNGARVFSQCSRVELNRFVGRGRAACLHDEPKRQPYARSTAEEALPPGALYGADFQCRQLLGLRVRDVGEDGEGGGRCPIWEEKACEELWCLTPGRSTCLSAGRPAAEGTPCGVDRWCWDGRCVQQGLRPNAVDGAWGEWGPWTPCSRSCGGGVQTSRRQCSSPPPSAGGFFCEGPHTRRRACATEPCDPCQPSFRQAQCSAFDGPSASAGGLDAPAGARNVTWRAYVGTRFPPCELACTAHQSGALGGSRGGDGELGGAVKGGGGELVSLAKCALDGTPCRSGTKDMCVECECMKVDCDWRFGGDSVEDACGICNGAGVNCAQTDQIINASCDVGGGGALTPLTTVPAGARRVVLDEMRPSRALLAVGAADGRRWYLHGDSLKRAEGEVVLGQGVRGVLTFPEPDREMVVIPGPTKEPLVVALAGACDAVMNPPIIVTGNSSISVVAANNVTQLASRHYMQPGKMVYSIVTLRPTRPAIFNASANPKVHVEPTIRPKSTSQLKNVAILRGDQLKRLSNAKQHLLNKMFNKNSTSTDTVTTDTKCGIEVSNPTSTGLQVSTPKSILGSVPAEKISNNLVLNVGDSAKTNYSFLNTDYGVGTTCNNVSVGYTAVTGAGLVLGENTVTNIRPYVQSDTPSQFDARTNVHSGSDFGPIINNTISSVISHREEKYRDTNGYDSRVKFRSQEKSDVGHIGSDVKTNAPYNIGTRYGVGVNEDSTTETYTVSDTEIIIKNVPSREKFNVVKTNAETDGSAYMRSNSDKTRNAAMVVNPESNTISYTQEDNIDSLKIVTAGENKNADVKPVSGQIDTMESNSTTKGNSGSAKITENEGGILINVNDDIKDKTEIGGIAKIEDNEYSYIATYPTSAANSFVASSMTTPTAATSLAESETTCTQPAFHTTTSPTDSPMAAWEPPVASQVGYRPSTSSSRQAASVRVTYGIVTNHALRTPHYAWEFLSWGDCSAVCGGGAQVATADCVELGGGGRVHPRYCNPELKPPVKTKRCNTDACETFWRTGRWSGCGECALRLGMQTRQVQCVRRNSVPSEDPIAVADDHCRAPKPLAIKLCTRQVSRSEISVPGSTLQNNHTWHDNSAHNNISSLSNNAENATGSKDQIHILRKVLSIGEMEKSYTSTIGVASTNSTEKPQTVQNFNEITGKERDIRSALESNEELATLSSRAIQGTSQIKNALQSDQNIEINPPVSNVFIEPTEIISTLPNFEVLVEKNRINNAQSSNIILQKTFDTTPFQTIYSIQQENVFNNSTLIPDTKVPILSSVGSGFKSLKSVPVTQSTLAVIPNPVPVMTKYGSLSNKNITEIKENLAKHSANVSLQNLERLNYTHGCCNTTTPESLQFAEIRTEEFRSLPITYTHSYGANMNQSLSHVTYENKRINSLPTQTPLPTKSDQLFNINKPVEVLKQGKVSSSEHVKKPIRNKNSFQHEEKSVNISSQSPSQIQEPKLFENTRNAPKQGDITNRKTIKKLNQQSKFYKFGHHAKNNKTFVSHNNVLGKNNIIHLESKNNNAIKATKGNGHKLKYWGSLFKKVGQKSVSKGVDPKDMRAMYHTNAHNAKGTQLNQNSAPNINSPQRKNFLTQQISEPLETKNYTPVVAKERQLNQNPGQNINSPQRRNFLTQQISEPLETKSYTPVVAKHVSSLPVSKKVNPENINVVTKMNKTPQLIANDFKFKNVSYTAYRNNSHQPHPENLKFRNIIPDLVSPKSENVAGVTSIDAEVQKIPNNVPVENGTQATSRKATSQMGLKNLQVENITLVSSMPFQGNPSSQNYNRTRELLTLTSTASTESTEEKLVYQPGFNAVASGTQIKPSNLNSELDVVKYQNQSVNMQENVLHGPLSTTAIHGQYTQNENILAYFNESDSVALNRKPFLSDQNLQTQIDTDIHVATERTEKSFPNVYMGAEEKGNAIGIKFTEPINNIQDITPLNYTQFYFTEISVSVAPKIQNNAATVMKENREMDFLMHGNISGIPNNKTQNQDINKILEEVSAVIGNGMAVSKEGTRGIGAKVSENVNFELTTPTLHNLGTTTEKETPRGQFPLGDIYLQSGNFLITLSPNNTNTLSQNDMRPQIGTNNVQKQFSPEFQFGRQNQIQKTNLIPKASTSPYVITCNASKIVTQSKGVCDTASLTTIPPIFKNLQNQNESKSKLEVNELQKQNIRCSTQSQYIDRKYIQAATLAGSELNSNKHKLQQATAENKTISICLTSFHPELKSRLEQNSQPKTQTVQFYNNPALTLQSGAQGEMLGPNKEYPSLSSIAQKASTASLNLEINRAKNNSLTFAFEKCTTSLKPMNNLNMNYTCGNLPLTASIVFPNGGIFVKDNKNTSKNGNTVNNTFLKSNDLSKKQTQINSGIPVPSRATPKKIALFSRRGKSKEKGLLGTSLTILTLNSLLGGTESVSTCSFTTKITNCDNIYTPKFSREVHSQYVTLAKQSSILENDRNPDKILPVQGGNEIQSAYKPVFTTAAPNKNSELPDAYRFTELGQTIQNAGTDIKVAGSPTHPQLYKDFLHTGLILNNEPIRYTNDDSKKTQHQIELIYNSTQGDERRFNNQIQMFVTPEFPIRTNLGDTTAMLSPKYNLNFISQNGQKIMPQHRVIPRKSGDISKQVENMNIVKFNNGKNNIFSNSFLSFVGHGHLSKSNKIKKINIQNTCFSPKSSSSEKEWKFSAFKENNLSELQLKSQLQRKKNVITDNNNSSPCSLPSLNHRLSVRTYSPSSTNKVTEEDLSSAFHTSFNIPETIEVTKTPDASNDQIQNSVLSQAKPSNNVASVKDMAKFPSLAVQVYGNSSVMDSPVRNAETFSNGLGYENTNVTNSFGNVSTSKEVNYGDGATPRPEINPSPTVSNSPMFVYEKIKETRKYRRRRLSERFKSVIKNSRYHSLSTPIPEERHLKNYNSAQGKSPNLSHAKILEETNRLHYGHSKTKTNSSAVHRPRNTTPYIPLNKNFPPFVLFINKTKKANFTDEDYEDDSKGRSYSRNNISPSKTMTETYPKISSHTVPLESYRRNQNRNHITSNMIQPYLNEEISNSKSIKENVGNKNTNNFNSNSYKYYSQKPTVNSPTFNKSVRKEQEAARSDTNTPSIYNLSVLIGNNTNPGAIELKGLLVLPNAEYNGFQRKVEKVEENSETKTLKHKIFRHQQYNPLLKEKSFRGYKAHEAVHTQDRKSSGKVTERGDIVQKSTKLSPENEQSETGVRLIVGNVVPRSRARTNSGSLCVNKGQHHSNSEKGRNRGNKLASEEKSENNDEKEEKQAQKVTDNLYLCGRTRSVVSKRINYMSEPQHVKLQPKSTVPVSMDSTALSGTFNKDLFTNYKRRRGKIISSSNSYSSNIHLPPKSELNPQTKTSRSENLMLSSSLNNSLNSSNQQETKNWNHGKSFKVASNDKGGETNQNNEELNEISSKTIKNNYMTKNYPLVNSDREEHQSSVLSPSTSGRGKRQLVMIEPPTHTLLTPEIPEYFGTSTSEVLTSPIIKARKLHFPRHSSFGRHHHGLKTPNKQGHILGDTFHGRTSVSLSDSSSASSTENEKMRKYYLSRRGDDFFTSKVFFTRLPSTSSASALLEFKREMKIRDPSMVSALEFLKEKLHTKMCLHQSTSLDMSSFSTQNLPKTGNVPYSTTSLPSTMCGLEPRNGTATFSNTLLVGKLPSALSTGGNHVEQESSKITHTPHRPLYHRLAHSRGTILSHRKKHKKSKMSLLTSQHSRTTLGKTSGTNSPNVSTVTTESTVESTSSQNVSTGTSFIHEMESSEPFTVTNQLETMTLISNILNFSYVKKEKGQSRSTKENSVCTTEMTHYPTTYMTAETEPHSSRKLKLAAMRDSTLKTKLVHAPSLQMAPETDRMIQHSSEISRINDSSPKMETSSRFTTHISSDIIVQTPQLLICSLNEVSTPETKISELHTSSKLSETKSFNSYLPNLSTQKELVAQTPPSNYRSLYKSTLVTSFLQNDPSSPTEACKNIDLYKNSDMNPQVFRFTKVSAVDHTSESDQYQNYEKSETTETETMTSLTPKSSNVEESMSKDKSSKPYQLSELTSPIINVPTLSSDETQIEQSKSMVRTSAQCFSKFSSIDKLVSKTEANTRAPFSMAAESKMLTSQILNLSTMSTVSTIKPHKNTELPWSSERISPKKKFPSVPSKEKYAMNRDHQPTFRTLNTVSRPNLSVTHRTNFSTAKNDMPQREDSVLVKERTYLKPLISQSSELSTIQKIVSEVERLDLLTNHGASEPNPTVNQTPNFRSSLKCQSQYITENKGSDSKPSASPSTTLNTIEESVPQKHPRELMNILRVSDMEPPISHTQRITTIGATFRSVTSATSRAKRQVLTVLPTSTARVVIDRLPPGFPLFREAALLSRRARRPLSEEAARAGVAAGAASVEAVLDASSAIEARGDDARERWGEAAERLRMQRKQRVEAEAADAG